jgi:tol-pal system protein YbgF
MTLALVLLPAGGLFAQENNAPIEQRLDRLERVIDSQGLADILMRLNALEEEVRQLRGENEEQAHTIEELKQRQRELYIDLDRRLLQVERAGQSGTAADEPEPAANSSSASRRPSGKPTGGSLTMTPPRSTSDDQASDSASEETPDNRVVKSEQQAYQDAFNQLRELEYARAVQAFREFLRDYPDGRYAHIARYWLGEANYARGEYQQAIGDYQNLIERYPNSPKVAEAMLKIGYSHHQLQAYKPARDILERLIADYPGTTEASQARNLLQKIRANQSNN